MRIAVLAGLMLFFCAAAYASVTKERALEATVNVLGMAPMVASGDARAEIVEDESLWPPEGEPYKGGKTWAIRFEYTGTSGQDYYWVDRETGNMV